MIFRSLILFVFIIVIVSCGDNGKDISNNETKTIEILNINYDKNTTINISENIKLYAKPLAKTNNYYFNYDRNKTISIDKNIFLSSIYNHDTFNIKITKAIDTPIFIRIKDDKNTNIVDGYYYDSFTKELGSGNYQLYLKQNKTEINKDLIILNNDVGLFLNIKHQGTDAIFFRLSTIDNVNLINGYQYGDINIYLKEGFYKLYIKENGKEIIKNILIKGKNKGVSNNFTTKNTHKLRDIPYIDEDSTYIFNWFPQTYSDIKSKYIFQIKIDGNITTEITNATSFKYHNILDKFSYRVIAFPEVFFTDDFKIDEYFDLNLFSWIDIDLTKNIDDKYLFGTLKSIQGNIDDLSLYYPSGFAFGSDKEYIISSADGGSIVVVKDKKFKRYLFKNNLGMPLKLSQPKYKGSNKYLLTDNRNFNILEFDSKLGTMKLIAGDKDGKYFENILSDKLHFNDKLGIFNGLTYSNSQYYISLSQAYKENLNSWYPVQKRNSNIYKIDFSNNLIQNINSTKEFCSQYDCNYFYNIENNMIVRGDNYLAKLDDKGKVIWKTKVNRFGRGLVYINNHIILGEHTKLRRLNINTGEDNPISSTLSFANIIDIDKIDAENLVITDSDKGSVFFVTLKDDKLSLIKSISSSTRTPVYTKIHKENNKLFVMTSNPSYLFSFDMLTKKADFLIGNGGNNPASLNQNGLKSSLSYPNGFLLTNNTIYIPEANNRIIQLDRTTGDISLFAGSRHNGYIVGSAKCDEALFTNVRSILKEDDKFIISDAGNNRIISMQKKDNLCTISEIKIRDKGKLNYPTYLFKNKDKNYLIEQDANVIYQFDKKGILDTIGSRRSVVYQGMGKDNYKTVNKRFANFSTPAGICFNNSQRGGMYIMDLFNGKIKVLKNDMVSEFIYNGNYKLPSNCEIYNNKIYFIDSITNKLYFQELKE